MHFRDYGEWLLSQSTEDSSSTTAPEAPFATEPGLASLVSQRLPTVNGASLDGCMKGACPLHVTPVKLIPCVRRRMASGLHGTWKLS